MLSHVSRTLCNQSNILAPTVPCRILAMADLDDFFAKKDRKKAKGKKFTTTDEVAKKLEETGKRLEKPKPKEKPANPEGGEEIQQTEVSLRPRRRRRRRRRIVIPPTSSGTHGRARRCHVCERAYERGVRAADGDDA